MSSRKLVTCSLQMSSRNHVTLGLACKFPLENLQLQSLACKCPQKYQSVGKRRIISKCFYLPWGVNMNPLIVVCILHYSTDTPWADTHGIENRKIICIIKVFFLYIFNAAKSYFCMYNNDTVLLKC